MHMIQYVKFFNPDQDDHRPIDWAKMSDHCMAMIHTDEFLPFWNSLQPPNVRKELLTKEDEYGFTIAHRIALEGESKLFIAFWQTLSLEDQEICACLNARWGWTVAHCVARSLDTNTFFLFWNSLSDDLKNHLAIQATHHEEETLGSIIFDYHVKEFYWFWSTLTDETKGILTHKHEKVKDFLKK